MQTLSSQGKNQKAITQFFKTVPCSQEKISPVKQKQPIETKANISKRKADSPIIIKQEDSITHDSINFSSNTLKKVKISENHGCKVLFDETSNFPGKPNCANVTISPRKELVTKKLFVDTENGPARSNNHIKEFTVQDTALHTLKMKFSPKKIQRRSNEKENCCMQYFQNNVEFIDNNLISNSAIEKQYQSPKKNLIGMLQYFYRHYHSYYVSRLTMYYLVDKL